MRAEFQAAADNDAKGWMIWNARARFTEAALGAPRDGEDAGTVVTGGAPEPSSSSSVSPSAEPSASP